MNNQNKKIRFLPIIGITLTLAGYIFLVFQTFKLNERKNTLRLEISDLENIKTRLIKEAKKKDAIITIQDTIISQSKDKQTVEKGIELTSEINAPNSNYFIVTNKETSNIELAQKFESDGFNYLLQKDVSNAITSFRKSENSLNGYHLVYDIAYYLNKNKQKLSDKNSEFWKEAFQKILKDYSWKIPDEIKLKLTAMSK